MTEAQFKGEILPCYGKMYAIALAILRNADDASDAVQDVVASLWQKRASIALPDNPEAYCCTAMRHACVDRLRSAMGRYTEAIDALMQVSATDRTDARASFRNSLACVNHVLDTLPANQRTVLSLSFISGLSNQEICDATGLSATNVRQIISRGRLRLRSQLTDI